MHHMFATSIAGHGYSREWCTSTDLFFLYCLLYRRPCALAHGLAQYYASAHHRQERGFLYGGAYATVIARSLGIVPDQDPHLRTPPVMPTRMGFPSLWGMSLIRRFVVGPRFKNRDGDIWTEEALTEQFELVYPPADPADVVPVLDPPVDLDGAAMPQPPPPPGAPQFQRHVIPGHALGAALHLEVRAELDRLNDLVGWLVRDAQDRRERERGVTRDTAPTSSSTTSVAAAATARSRFGFGSGCIHLLLFLFLLSMYKLILYIFVMDVQKLSCICHIYVCFQLFGYFMIVVLN
ncbi:hypothetical protein HanPSC8_Chr03g0087101 [Helianthus annuus]|nr:hypothetical protein HanPSC8_Chr03g0087101 [Helianthus annuus]